MSNGTCIPMDIDAYVLVARDPDPDNPQVKLDVKMEVGVGVCEVGIEPSDDDGYMPGIRLTLRGPTPIDETDGSVCLTMSIETARKLAEAILTSELMNPRRN
jgi:hypothetical protein